jgi:porin
MIELSCRPLETNVAINWSATSRLFLPGVIALLPTTLHARAGLGELAQTSDTAVHTRSAPPLAEPAEDAEGPALDLSAVYTADLWSNTGGGRKRGVRYLDNLDVTLTVDAERALGWSGATIFLYGLYNNGASLTDELVGDLQTVSNIDAGTRAIRLYEAWIEQRFADDRASVKFGLYDLNSEFDTNDSNSLFINSSHGIGPDFSQSGQNGPSIFPVTSLSLRADYRLNENWLVRAAILDGAPGDPNRPKRTAVKLSKEDGALIVAELQYTDAMTKVAAGHWRYTAKFDDILASEVAGTSIWRSGNDGFYVFGERKLAGATKDGPGLAAWARLGFADASSNAIEQYLGGGLVYTGLITTRPEDQLGIAIAHARLGTPYRRQLALAGGVSERAETNIELTYRAALTPWLTLQPDVQYVINPGGNPALRNALLVGLRVEVGF